MKSEQPHWTPLAWLCNRYDRPWYCFNTPNRDIVAPLKARTVPANNETYEQN